jgi:RNA polymerase sigma factor (sigma-70 family)
VEPTLQLLAREQVQAKSRNETIDAHQSACAFTHIYPGPHSLKLGGTPMKQAAPREPIDPKRNQEPEESELASEDYLDLEQQRATLHAKMKRLPPRIAHVYSLRFEQGLSFAEIARRLTIKISTVKAHLRRAAVLCANEQKRQKDRRPSRRRS